MMMDPIADFLTRIRNSLKMKHSHVSAPYSKINQNISHILKKASFISDVAVEQEKEGFQNLVLTLRYDDKGAPLIEGLKRVSKPGLRVYRKTEDLPLVRGGLGIAVISTSKGLVLDAEARKMGIGGEVLCFVW